VPVRHMGTEVRPGQAGTDGGEPVDGERVVTTTGAQGKQRGKEPGEGENLTKLEGWLTEMDLSEGMHEDIRRALCAVETFDLADFLELMPEEIDMLCEGCENFIGCSLALRRMSRRRRKGSGVNPKLAAFRREGEAWGRSSGGGAGATLFGSGSAAGASPSGASTAAAGGAGAPPFGSGSAAEASSFEAAATGASAAGTATPFGGATSEEDEAAQAERGNGGEAENRGPRMFGLMNRAEALGPGTQGKQRAKASGGSDEYEGDGGAAKRTEVGYPTPRADSSSIGERHPGRMRMRPDGAAAEEEEPIEEEALASAVVSKGGHEGARAAGVSGSEETFEHEGSAAQTADRMEVEMVAGEPSTEEEGSDEVGDPLPTAEHEAEPRSAPRIPGKRFGIG